MTTRLPVRWIAVLSVAALPATARAQSEPLFAPPIHPAVENIRGTAPGDVNEDGLPDLVVWAFGPSVMLGLQGGGFAAPVAVDPGQAVSCRLADFDEDGHLDIVAVNAFDDTIRTFAGHGDGTFDPFVSIDSAPDLRDAIVADFNDDGHLDLAAAGLHNGRVSVHLGHGDGTFDPKLDSGLVGDFASAVTAADLTGDGVLDLAVSSGNDAQVSLLVGDGDGTFTPVAPLLMPGGVADVGAIDLDGDGDRDLVVSMVSTGLRVVFNAGGGSFLAPAFAYPLPSFVNTRLVVADFDENGRDDVAIGIGANDMVVVYRSTGLAGGGTLVLAGTYITDRNPQQLSCADMDLDGDLDLIAANFDDHDVRILRGEGDGGFRTGTGPWPVGSDSVSVAAGDLNGDGRTDVVICGTGPALSVTLNAGNGHFPTATAWPVPSNLHFDAMIADFNGDGHADVATANWEPAAPGATIVLGAGNGQPLAVKTLTVPFGAWAWIDAADFDLDGDLDVVLGADGISSDGEILVAFNDGDGDLSPAPLLETGVPPAMSVCTGDFDEDGAPDIAVSHNSLDGRITIFLGDGAGGFARPTHIETDSAQRDLGAADFDGDGHLDLAAATYTGHIAVHAGLGDGTFGPASLFGSLPNGGFGLEIGDLDHDGIDDIATADLALFDDVGTLSVLIGNGDGSFQPATQFLTGKDCWRLALGDFDGDGWNDLVTAPRAGMDVLLNRRGPWNELGHGLAGVQGIPRQTGIGTLVPGQPFAFQLRDAKPLTTAFHVVGLSPLNHAFKGGVMVPSIDFINGFPFTNAQGNVTLAGPWIAAPSGLTLYFQFWQKDPAGAFGFSASTAISGTTP